MREDIVLSMKKAFQDYYPETFAHCYGCGRLNEQGLHIRSFWDGDESVCTFNPRPYHTALPGYVYGGLIASVIDCHGTGTAAGAAYRRDHPNESVVETQDLGRLGEGGRSSPERPPSPAASLQETRPYRFVTASLKVDYLKPTPLGPPLILRGVVKELKGRKAVIDITLSANDVVCARGEVICVQVDENFGAAV